MRTLVPSILAATLLLLGASSAGAFAISHTTNYDGSSALQVSDTVTVNVFLDTQGAGHLESDSGAGLSNVSLGVVFSSPQLSYDSEATGALPEPSPYAYLNTTYYGTYTVYDNGSQSSYVLYAYEQAPNGTFPGNPGGYLVPQQTPWQTWPAPQPGEGQVNFNWVPPGASPDFSQQTAASSNTWLGSIVLNVDDVSGGTAETGLYVAGCTSCSVRTGDGVVHTDTTTIDARTTLTLPEPTAPALSMAALAALYGIRRIRRRS